MLKLLNRLLAPLCALVLLITLFKYMGEYWPSSAGVDRFLGSMHGYFWFFLLLCLLTSSLLVLGLLHDRQRLPKALQRPALMDILDRLTNKSAIEQGLDALDDAVLIDAQRLAGSLKRRVIGQDAVCDDIAAQIRRRLAMSKRDKPVGVFMFAGPPGTGKTYLAKVLAKELARELLHLDMSQYASGAHSLSQLLGMNKGYVGSDSYGLLTAALRDNPQAVVLLDEVEKAHPDVLKAFLTAWNDGFVTERSDGQQVSTRHAVFVLTSNACTDRLGEIAVQFADEPDQLRAAATNTLKESHFAPEVLNRIDRLFVFRPLAGLDVARVAALEIEAMIQNYELKVAEGGIDPEIILALIVRQRRLGRSASSRDLVRAIEEEIADSLIEAKQHDFDTVTLSFDDGQRVRAKAFKSTGRR